MKKDLINYLEEKLNLKILTIDNLYGGCINESFKLETRSQKYFIKINYNLNLFSLEKEGLETLRSTNTFYIPEVIMYGRFKETYYLIMEFIDGIKFEALNVGFIEKKLKENICYNQW